MNLDIGDVQLADNISSLANILVEVANTEDEELIKKVDTSMNEMWVEIDEIFSTDWFNKEIMNIMRKKQIDNLK